MSAPSCAKPGSVPSASLKSRPRPSMPSARSCCQVRNCARVCGSRAWKISSSSTVGLTWPLGSRPPSGIVFCDAPGVSSTYVSPSSDFWRSVAFVSVFSGANLRSISSVASVRLEPGSSVFLRSLPTETPATRTSASSPSCVASGKPTWTR